MTPSSFDAVHNEIASRRNGEPVLSNIALKCGLIIPHATFAISNSETGLIIAEADGRGPIYCEISEIACIEITHKGS